MQRKRCHRRWMACGIAAPLAVMAAIGAPAAMAATAGLDAPGSAYPWQGSVGGLNTVNGNKLTTVPIVGWTARGGMPVSFALYHSSQSTRNAELGEKWSHSFDITGSVDGSGNFTVTWGDGMSYQFTKSGSTYSPPTGIHDTLTANGSPTITSYDLKTKGQVTFHFTNPNSTGWVCSTVTDRHGNAITVNHDTSNNVTTIVDPTSRTITLTYTSGKITSLCANMD